MEDGLRKRKQRIIKWIKDPTNLFLALIVIIGVAFRLHYFFLTKSQPLWWDEAEYMSTAKSFAGIMKFQYTWTLNRFPGFPLLASLFYLAGITNETVLKLFLEFIPSIIAIILMYFVILSMYNNKKTAVISTAIFFVLWEHVFYSNRFHTENLSLIFEFLAIIILFRVYLRDKDLGFVKSKHSLLWISAFAILCIFFRSGNMIFIPILALFLILVNFYKISEKNRLFFGLALLFLGILGFLLIVFLAPKYPILAQFYSYNKPIDWSPLTIFYGFYQSLITHIPSVFFYTFLIGISITLFNFFIFPEAWKKVYKNNKDKNNIQYKAEVFNLLLVVITLFFFIFMLRAGGFDLRWFFLILPAMFAITVNGIMKLGDFLGSLVNSKLVSALIILIILLLGLFIQINHADMIIKNKLDSYSQVKDSGLWMKENSNKSDIIVSASLMQHAYYSELETYNLDGFKEESKFEEFLSENHPRYLVLSVFQPHPEWALSWPQNNAEKATPVKAYFADAQQTQPVLVIYEFN